MLQLPEAYIQQMKALLDAKELEQFLHTYQSNRTYGLRFNPLKEMDDTFISLLEHQFQLTPVSWCKTGHYYAPETRPGKHPYHAAGLYYIQEPSAMSAVELLDPQPGEKVLDLAAAPGGKATHIAAKMKGKGLLLANEIHPGRAAILSENIERFGIPNGIVISSAPDELVDAFSNRFDRIMLDAPCSGEGMFRKEPETIQEWSLDHVAMCARRQLDILRSAAKLLKPGGTLVYSTCTFSREENEEVIEKFLSIHDDFERIHQERFWPHRCQGEGHFIAKLTKHAVDSHHVPTDSKSKLKKKKQRSKYEIPPFIQQEVEKFMNHLLPDFKLPGNFHHRMFGEQIYAVPALDQSGLDITGLLEGKKVLRFGLHLGTWKKNRFEPAHALALAIPHMNNAKHQLQLEAGSEECKAYLRGETVPCDKHGWVLVGVDGFPLGWGKANQGILKNHYPKGLRWRI